MQQIDFITAFARLLKDGSLRDAYARDPLRTAGGLGVRPEERPSLLALNPKHLEFQAEVLLRKRFEAVSRLIPQTITNAGTSAWSLFADYAREVWPTGDPPELNDARQFCSFLASVKNLPVATGELNRVRFALGHRPAAMHFLSDGLARNRARPCLQILVRARGRAWRELLLYFG